jgi:phosphopantothenoylcysteine decarboxylase
LSAPPLPATANTIVKFAQGIADNLLTSLFLALPRVKKVVLVPAMNTKMWDNPNFQRALAELQITEADRRAKVTVVHPVDGMLACGDYGMGKIAPTKTIIEAVEKAINE